MKAFIVSQSLCNIANDYLIFGVFTSFENAANAIAENSEIPYEHFFGYDAPMTADEEMYKRCILESLEKYHAVVGDDYSYSIEEIELDKWFD